MNEITVGAARVPYRVLGQGRPLVLVHGTSVGSRNWDGVAAAFQDTRTVVLPDLSGSDAARDDGGELTVESLAEQVAAVITATGAGPADVVGHSMGAAVVAALAAGRPDLVRRIALVTGPVDQSDNYFHHAMLLWRGLAEDPAAFARLAMLLAFSRAHLATLSPAAVDELAAGYLPAPGRLRQLDLVLRLDIRDLLPRIQAPALVIACTHDAILAVDGPRQLAAGIPDSTYAEIDCGHMPMFEKPDELTKLVRDFLE
ncbi:alpha/beta hydrolase [Nocardia yunnanensis]|uniref:Alpha/beta hydrolase n=1 Tax=Nocardia yunnanensis TaxID=2382165 RepID=A0A386ZNC9_9NOCA|nr:alpha/beta hydrolase [Nocardia yunnanensis]AYF78075.1 alpha/beta hydrolase [Nocardia yunnanensis]